jgi:hypothetical protein
MIKLEIGIACRLCWRSPASAPGSSQKTFPGLKRNFVWGLVRRSRDCLCSIVRSSSHVSARSSKAPALKAPVVARLARDAVIGAQDSLANV